MYRLTLALMLCLISLAVCMPAVLAQVDTTAVAGSGDVKHAAISFGIGLLGSLITGKVQKSSLPKNRRGVIPATNPIMWGGGTAAITQDPISTISAVSGSLLATVLHQLIKRLSRFAN